jgi:hypothetical protein
MLTDFFGCFNFEFLAQFTKLGRDLPVSVDLPAVHTATLTKRWCHTHGLV